MKIIDINTYESYILDLVEGTISDVDRVALEQFLDLHPSIKEEIEEFELITLSPSIQTNHPNKKALLKKEIPNVIPFAYKRWIAAASVALLMGYSIFWIFNSDTEMKATLVETNIQAEDKIEKISDNDSSFIGIKKEELAVEEPKGSLKAQKHIPSIKPIIETENKGKEVVGVIKNQENRNYRPSLKLNNDKNNEASEVMVAIDAAKRQKRINESNLNVELSNRKSEIAFDVLKNDLQPIRSKIKRTRLSTDVNMKFDLAMLNQAKSKTPINRPLLRYVGKLAFANASASFIPSYLKNISENTLNKK